MCCQLYNSSPTDDDAFNDLLDRLRFFLPDNLILAALDLIDRDSGEPFLGFVGSPFYVVRAGIPVIKYITPWGRSQYEVLGSTANYTVFIELPAVGSGSLEYCTCPAFAYSVLKSESQLMVSLLYD